MLPAPSQLEMDLKWLSRNGYEYSSKDLPMPQTGDWYDKNDDKYGWWARDYFQFEQIAKCLANIFLYPVFDTYTLRPFNFDGMELAQLTECTWTYIWFIWRLNIQFISRTLIQGSQWWGKIPDYEGKTIRNSFWTGFVANKKKLGYLEHYDKNGACIQEFFTILPPHFLFAYVEIQHFRRIAEESFHIYLPWGVCLEIVSLTIELAYYWRYDVNTGIQEWFTSDGWIPAAPVPHIRWVFKSMDQPKLWSQRWNRWKHSVYFPKIPCQYYYDTYYKTPGQKVWFLTPHIGWIQAFESLKIRFEIWLWWVRRMEQKALLNTSQEEQTQDTEYWNTFFKACEQEEYDDYWEHESNEDLWINSEVELWINSDRDPRDENVQVEDCSDHEWPPWPKQIWDQ